MCLLNNPTIFIRLYMITGRESIEFSENFIWNKKSASLLYIADRRIIGL
ncbi:hypothetical protein D2M30_1338 [Bacillus amyloliquefaciens]|nr:hypothetical protein D2M30_1338 [Bacillus amyloliquefaciens]